MSEDFNTEDPLMNKLYKQAQKKVDEKWKKEQYIGHMKNEMLNEMFSEMVKNKQVENNQTDFNDVIITNGN